jgi:hypothetical protein
MLWLTLAASLFAGGFQAGDPGAVARDAKVAALKQIARTHMDDERRRFSESELADIEARYRSAHADGRIPFLQRPEGTAMLEQLIERYPRSNRAGCAVLELARVTSGREREQYLRTAISSHSDAWFENGVQVGAMARAMLAVHLAGLDRFDEAEAIAKELVTRYPGAIDETGASLDDLLESVKLLRRSPAGAA